jgi:hypothetical protein
VVIHTCAVIHRQLQIFATESGEPSNGNASGKGLKHYCSC